MKPKHSGPPGNVGPQSRPSGPLGPRRTGGIPSKLRREAAQGRPGPAVGRPVGKAPFRKKGPPPGVAAGKGAALKTDWSDAAEWYDNLVGESGSEYHQKVVLPGVVRLLALQAGEKAIDIACGQGVLCRLLAERGVEVTGVDAAEPLIKSAIERGPSNIRYQVEDATKLHPLPAAQYTAASCVLAIQNIASLPPVFQGVQRLLKVGGRFVIVMMHPCFRGPKETMWGWDKTKDVQFRRVDRYLLPRKTPIVTHPGSAPDEYTWDFHRPIEGYVRALRNAGLLIDSIEEWTSHKTSQPGPRAAAENAARKEIPMFLAIRAIKVAQAWSEGAANSEPANGAE